MEKIVAMILTTTVVTMVGMLRVFAQDNPETEKKIRELVRQLTLEEKLSMLGGTGFESRGVDRLGIPALNMTDGPVGVRWSSSTAFPVSIALAASWDTALAGRYGRALGREAKAKGRRMLLGPCVNINRVPNGGRDFESFGEDPYLTSRMAVEYVKGVQSEHVAACTKHYAANNQEWERESISVEADERTLREIYFPAFKAAVQEGGSWSIMSAYNKVNGTWCSENSFLLSDVLKKEWGFKGLVVSDWGAVHSMVPTVNAGLDIEMPEGKYLRPDDLMEALRRGEVKESVIDDKITRLLRVMMWAGLFGTQVPSEASVVNGPEHRKLAREVAAAGTVLLKNEEAILPIDPHRIHSIAVIGPNAAVARTGGGGSSLVQPFYSVSPLEGITTKAGKGITVRYAQGCPMPGDITPVESSALRPPGGKPGETGLRGEYFSNQDFDGTPSLVRVDAQIDFDWGDGGPAAGLPTNHFSVRWTGYVNPTESAEYTLSIRSDDGSRLYVNDELLIDNWGDHAGVAKSRTLRLEKDKAYAVRLEYYENRGGAIVQFGWQKGVNRELQEAVDAAAQSDLALVVVGNTSTIESEGFDRSSLNLPGGQDELIEAVVKVNPRTVVVLNSGAPVLMPWADKVPAIVEAWFGGQEAGNALAELLFGDVNPAGKLPVTFLREWKDTPAFSTYPGKEGRTEYSEGIFVGYRHFDREKIVPLFPFGHGLSYTTFGYAKMSVLPVSGSNDKRYSVSVEVTNTGGRAGSEVVQIYVSDGHSSVPRPPQELKAFARVALQPGEKATVRLALDESSFAFFDPAKKRWTVEPGTFTVHAGSSSRDLRLSQPIVLR